MSCLQVRTLLMRVFAACPLYKRDKYQADMKPFSDWGTARFVSGNHECFLCIKADRLSWSEDDASDNELAGCLCRLWNEKLTFIFLNIALN